MFDNQSELNYMFTASESHPSVVLDDFVFNEFDNCKFPKQMNSIKCENAFDQYFYPFGDWRDLADIKSKSWNFDSVSIQSECSNKKPELIQKSEPLYQAVKKVFKVEKVSKSERLEENVNSMNVNKKNKNSNICENSIVSSIFIENGFSSKSNKSCRRDVINKSILRYFHRFMKKVFSDLLEEDSYPEDRRLSGSFNSFGQNISVSSILSALMKLKLISNKKSKSESEKNLNNSMVEYVKWLQNGMKMSESVFSSSECDSSKASSHSKIYQSSVQRLNELNSPVKIMNELLFRYSHYKLQKFFEDDACRRLFKYFLSVEKDNFINEFNESKRLKLIESLEDFERNIISFQ